MFSPSQLDKVIGVLKKAAKRALNLKLPGYHSPYYVAFIVRDIEKIYVTASAGSIFEIERTPKRLVYCDCRVGTPRNDQTEGIPKTSHDEERQSAKYSQLPLEDDNLYAFETSLWRLSEIRYREALKEFQEKQAARVLFHDFDSKLISFWPVKPVKSISMKKFSKLDVSWWRNYVKKISRYINAKSDVSFDYVFGSHEKEIRIFVSTENAVIVDSTELFSIGFEMHTHAWDGQMVKVEHVINVKSPSEIPNQREIKALIEKKYEDLKKLAFSRKIYSYSGPALLYPIPAGLLFHETLGHRLEGDRLLSKSEGLTLKGQIGKRILNTDVTVEDNPLLESFNNRGCWGAYRYDDQGTPAERTVLVEGGVLKQFLTSRSQCFRKNFKPNGHARASDANPPMSRMGVMIIKPSRGYPLETLKKMLIAEINKQNKPYGVIIEEAVDGETKTTSYDPQTFAGRISLCRIVYPDGQEEVVRGLSFVGTPLQALSQIVAFGDTSELDNSFCVAESGTIPVSTISPAVLIRNIELQATDEDSHPPFILPKPRPKK